MRLHPLNRRQRFIRECRLRGLKTAKQMLDCELGRMADRTAIRIAQELEGNWLPSVKEVGK